ncbi:MAG: cation:proton antiporter [Halobacteriaceae archaeon]
MAAAGGLITVTAVVIGVGVAAQVLAARLQVPSIVFLIAIGIVLGPSGIGMLGPHSFGGALGAIVGLSVAIIVFEGAFHIRVSTLREAPAVVLRLTTVGAVVSLAGTALAVKAFIPAATWGTSFLVGALLIATGPTVIAPILEVVPVRDRVAAALETEGIVNDVTAAVLAIAIFEAILAETTDPAAFVDLFAARLGIGVIVGCLVAGSMYYLLRYVDLSPGNAPQLARLLVLAGALVAYAAAEELRTEAGIAAVATAGIVLGNLDVPYEEQISEFKGDITLIVLSFVFVALAALLDVSGLFELGVGGLAVVAAVGLLVRPLLVFVSTLGVDYTRGEKLFVSVVGPRGIIPASVATLFAIQLRDAGMGTQADILVGVVFLVILATVVFEGGFARRIAEHLDVIPMRVIIVGGGRVGRALAARLEERGENVVIVENDEGNVEVARNEGFTVHIGDGTDTDVLRSAGAENARIVVAATGDDDVNLLVAQLANSKFDPETVLARANNPDNVEAFEELGVRTVSSTLASAWAIDNLIERPAMASWMTEIGRSGDVQEVELTSGDLVGMTIRELGPALPEESLIALVSRDGETRVPDADFTLEAGDRITIIGQREAVREAMDFCHPEP